VISESETVSAHINLRRLKEMKSVRCLFLAAIAFSLLTGAGPAQAAYPEQPITLICPWGAGGGTDAVARIIAGLMQKELGVPVNVVNRTGGNGVTGHQAILSAKPDGYTIGIGTVELAMIHWMGLAKFTAADFNPVGGVNLDSAAITVRADSPWQDYKTLQADLRANPGKYTASGTAAGGIWHLAMAAWLTGEGLAPSHVRWIPSDGAASAQQEMMAGGVDIITCSLPEVSAMVDAGRLKVLAYMADERNPKYPDVPTLKELGVPVSVGTWRGISAPMGLPKELRDRLETTLAKVVDSREFTDFMQSRGLGVKYVSAEEWGKFTVEADAQLGLIMKEAGLVK
jgi:tripartite-type tricarboxylate transporter receptor subunit TctC